MPRFPFRGSVERHRPRPAADACTGQGGLAFDAAPADLADRLFAPLGGKRGNLDVRFAAWFASADGQQVFQLLRARALQVARETPGKLGAKAIVESIRWEEELHVNNLYVSRLARALVQAEPMLRGRIELRELDTERQKTG